MSISAKMFLLPKMLTEPSVGSVKNKKLVTKENYQRTGKEKEEEEDT